MRIEEVAFVCPYCGVRFSEVANPRRGPRDLDTLLCWHCRRPSVFVDSPFGLALRPIRSRAELERIFADWRRNGLLEAVESTASPQDAAAKWRAQRRKV